MDKTNIAHGQIGEAGDGREEKAEEDLWMLFEYMFHELYKERESEGMWDNEKPWKFFPRWPQMTLFCPEQLNLRDHVIFFCRIRQVFVFPKWARKAEKRENVYLP